jgi:hypothetical protein
MSDSLLKFLASTQSPLVIAAFATLVALAFMRQYVDILIKLRQARRKEPNSPEEITTSLTESAPRSFDDPKKVVDFNFRLLEKYYDQTLAEYLLNSRATIVIACIGFVVILIGVAFVFSGIVGVGVLSSIAGLIAEGATVLFFKQNQAQVKQVEEYHRKLVSTQYLLTAISLTENLDGPTRQNEVKRIILNLLYLSNTLHGAQSSHLIDAPAKAVASTDSFVKEATVA